MAGERARDGKKQHYVPAEAVKFHFLFLIPLNS